MTLLYMQTVQGATRHLQQYASEQPHGDETITQIQNGIKSPEQSPRKVSQHNMQLEHPQLLLHMMHSVLPLSAGKDFCCE